MYFGRKGIDFIDAGWTFGAMYWALIVFLGGCVGTLKEPLLLYLLIYGLEKQKGEVFLVGWGDGEFFG